MGLSTKISVFHILRAWIWGGKVDIKWNQRQTLSLKSSPACPSVRIETIHHVTHPIFPWNLVIKVNGADHEKDNWMNEWIDDFLCISVNNQKAKRNGEWWFSTFWRQESRQPISILLALPHLLWGSIKLAAKPSLNCFDPKCQRIEISKSPQAHWHCVASLCFNFFS